MPGKIGHLVPMQRFDSIMIRRTLSLAKPSSPDYHPGTSNKSAQMVTTYVEVKATSNDEHASFPSAFSSSPSVRKSTSISSLKPAYDEATNVNKNNDDPNSVLSQTGPQAALSGLQQDLELTPHRPDIKRSSV